MGYLAIATWVCLALGFLVDPTFFLLGLVAFIGAAGWWTSLALQENVDAKTIAITWGVPVILFLAFGFAFMYLPQLPSEATEKE
jgi:hypothetical protein